MTQTLTTVRGMKITPLLRYPHHYNLARVTASFRITAAHCRHSTNFSNGPRISRKYPLPAPHIQIQRFSEFMTVCIKLYKIKNNSKRNQLNSWTAGRGYYGTFSPLHRVQTGSGAHPASYPSLRLTIHLHVVLRLKIRGSLPPFPVYHFMTWYSDALRLHMLLNVSWRQVSKSIHAFTYMTCNWIYYCF
jgi:hypothetical protein